MSKNKTVTHRCRQNDAILKFQIKDGELFEVWVQIKGEREWTIIGAHDLLEGVSKSYKAIQKINGN